MARSPSMQGEINGADQSISLGGKTGVERLLRILAWEIGILIFFLAYLAFARPLPGRFQFVALQEGEVVLYDTARFDFFSDPFIASNYALLLICF